MTATPRTYSTAIQKMAESRGVNITSMDDQSVFGSIFYKLNFSKAIKKELLTDYRVNIVGVNHQMIKVWIENRELLKTETGIETDAETLAAHIGLIKTTKEYDLRRVISFHSRVKAAKNFVKDHRSVYEWVPKSERPNGEMISDFVSGEMTTGQRNTKLGRLKILKNDQRALLSNARCLSEGVDVPSLDGVAFMDPKRSQVDIIQAVGRAIRKSEDKTHGTILIPVFIEKDEDLNEVFTKSPFRPVWDILNALQSHDDLLTEELDQLRFSLGKKPGFKIGEFKKINIHLPKNVSQNFIDNFKTILIESTTESWMFWYGLLKNYLEENGHCNVKHGHITKNGYKLGSWVISQRQRKRGLTSKKIELLNKIPGWSWNTNETAWERGLKYLKKYCVENRHSRVPGGFKTSDGFNLGNWAEKTRSKTKVLNDERIRQLEDIPEWSWDSIYDQIWENNYSLLLEYEKKHGSIFSLAQTEIFKGEKLEIWCNIQRISYKKNNLDEAKIARLEKINGWAWIKRETQWNKGFYHLEKFYQEHGNTRVPEDFETHDGFRLSDWVVTQKQLNEKIREDRRKKLLSIPDWNWDSRKASWENSFEELKEYYEKNKNLDFNGDFITSNGTKLGQWVTRQRTNYNKNKLSEERLNKLKSIEGWVWDPKEHKWFQMYKAFDEITRKLGHGNLTQDYVTDGGLNLGHWISTQRSWRKQNKLTKDRLGLLNKLDYWIWEIGTGKNTFDDDRWNMIFNELLMFYEKNNTLKVPADYKILNGFKLNAWIYAQGLVYKKKTMKQDRIKKLESLPGWVWQVTK